MTTIHDQQSATNTSRGDLINILMQIQEECTHALRMFPNPHGGQNMEVRTLANLILDSIRGTVTDISATPKNEQGTR